MAMEGSQAEGNAGQHRRHHRRTTPSVKDTLTVMIPMDVTVDLGVAMRRTRTKRLRRLRELYPELSASAVRGRGGAGAGNEGEKGGSDEKKAAGGGLSSGGEGENDEHDLDEDNDEGGASVGASSGTGLRREDYGSVLDYLEAKYVRGVQIGAAGPAMGDGEGGEEAAADLSDDDSGGGGSVYSDDSGIDDSMLRHEVYEQVMATGKYGGATKVEQEAKKAKKGRTESAKNSDDGGSGANDIPSTEGDGGFVDDDAFFVNVGDLEMADEGDYDLPNIDWNAVAKAEQSSKSKNKTKKKKKATSEAKKRDASGGSKPNSKETPKKKAKKSTEKSPKKKKDSGSTATSSSKKEKTKSPKKGSASPKKKGASTSKGGASPELSARAIELSAESAKLKAASDKLHRACVRRIKKCTEQDLPRKQKARKKAKVTVPIPADKGPGDVIVFKNPHIPEQKLRLTVPENWDRTKSGGNISVNVQKPVVTDDTKENDLPKLLKDALNEYSQAFDDWVEAEANYRDACPESMFEKDSFKKGVERLAKFDKMVKAFPKDLAEPIDASFLRMIVRRVRQAANKRRKAAGGATARAGRANTSKPTKAAVATKKRKIESKLAEMDDNAPPSMLEVRVPGKGAAFPAIHFDAKDFEKGN